MAQAIQGSTPQHVAADSRRVLETYSTPLLYTFFRLIGIPNYAHSLLIYQLIHFASGIAAIAIFGRVLRYSLTATLLMIAVMFGWGEAYLSEILCSNVNQVELLAIAILTWFELRPDSARRDYLCGGGIALIVLFKPNLIAVAGLLTLMWMVDRRFATLRRHVTGFALAAIAIVIVTSILFGSLRCWPQWLGAAGELQQLVAKEGKQVYSLESVAMARLGLWSALAIQYGVPVLALLAIGLTRVRTASTPPAGQWDVTFTSRDREEAAALSSGKTAPLRSRLVNKPSHAIAPAPPEESRRRIRAILLIALGCALPLISSPVCWLHYHILGVPLLMIALRPSQNGEERTWRFARYTLGIFALIVLCRSQLVTDWVWLDDEPSIAARVAGAAALLFVLALLELRIVNRGQPRLSSPL
jgi:hypothetical protein